MTGAKKPGKNTKSDNEETMRSTPVGDLFLAFVISPCTKLLESDFLVNMLPKGI